MINTIVNNNLMLGVIVSIISIIILIINNKINKEDINYTNCIKLGILVFVIVVSVHHLITNRDLLKSGGGNTNLNVEDIDLNIDIGDPIF